MAKQSPDQFMGLLNRGRDMKKPKATATAKPKPAEAQTVKTGKKATLSVVVDGDLLERARDAGYLTRRTLADLVADGLNRVLSDIAKTNGGKIPPRDGPVKTGRPIATKRKK